MVARCSRTVVVSRQQRSERNRRSDDRRRAKRHGLKGCLWEELCYVHTVNIRQGFSALLDQGQSLAAAGILSAMKVETESEGASHGFISRLRLLSGKIGVSLTLKVGGPNARRDFLFAVENFIDGITAPMIETSFAASQVREGIQVLGLEDFFSEINLLVESKEGIENLPDILASGQPFATGICFGRSDYARSLRHLGFEVAGVEDGFITDQIQSGVILAKELGFETTVGGAISLESRDNLLRLIDHGLDRVETRRCVLHAQDALADWDVLSEVLSFEREILTLEDRLKTLEGSQLGMNLDESNRRLDPSEP